MNKTLTPAEALHALADGWDYKDFMECGEEPPIDGVSPVPGIYFTFSKSLLRYFINFVTSESLDSYGIEWAAKQNCMTFTEIELDELIERIQAMKEAAARTRRTLSPI